MNKRDKKLLEELFRPSDATLAKAAAFSAEIFPRACQSVTRASQRAELFPHVYKMLDLIISRLPSATRELAAVIASPEFQNLLLSMSFPRYFMVHGRYSDPQMQNAHLSALRVVNATSTHPPPVPLFISDARVELDAPDAAVAELIRAGAASRTEFDKVQPTEDQLEMVMLRLFFDSLSNSAIGMLSVLNQIQQLGSSKLEYDNAVS
jgi:hypothetical protein